MNDETLIGITEAARQIGISHSTLSRQVKAGQVRSHNGRVRLSEVLHDRDRNIDKSVWLLRKKIKQTKKSGAGKAKQSTVHDTSTGITPCDDLIQPIGRLLGSILSDPVDVGTDCILAGMEMIEEEVMRLRATIKQLKTRATP